MLYDAEIISTLFPHVDSPPLNSRFIANTARDVTSLGSPFVLILLTLLGGVWLVGERDRAGQVFLGVVVAGGTIVSFVLKGLYDRPRPNVLSGQLLESSPSFPSGHSLMTAALLPALAIVFLRQEETPRIHRLFLLLGLLLAILVGLSRVLLGAHYPTDVLAGWSIGFGWVALCRAALLAYEEHGEREL